MSDGRDTPFVDDDDDETISKGNVMSSEIT
jgi:hypothetical protein